MHINGPILLLMLLASGMLLFFTILAIDKRYPFSVKRYPQGDNEDVTSADSQSKTEVSKISSSNSTTG